MAEPDAGRDRDDSRDPLDEDRAWAELVAAYGEQPDPEKGLWPATGGDDEPTTTGSGHRTAERTEEAGPTADRSPEDPGTTPAAPAAPPTDSGPTVRAAASPGPRDWSPADPAQKAGDADDEGHFVPPEPPPLPTGDTTSRFAWIAVLGGPLLLLVMVLLRQELTWWITTLGVGGFLGGFATLVLRMKDGDDEDDDPGRGAVV
ncbi:MULTISPECIES: hypothetical protein [Streptomyces]|uniref:DUF308 domain-containing protein n=1 Tax=Streptomyces luteosporeus TaxID=173856 RepID=A0ABN3U667_9ACTN